MAATLRHIADAAQVQLKQLGDDKQIPFPLIAQWCGFFINKYRYEKGGINDTKNQSVVKKASDTGNYLAIYSTVTINTASSSTNPDIVSGRKYITLPATIYDYHKDSGVDYISYSDFSVSCQPSFAGVTFTRTTPSKAKRLYFSEDETPKPDNPYFYRVGDYLYLLGLENISVASLEVGLRTAFDPFATGSLDAELDMGEEGFDYVVKQVLTLGRFMLQTPSDVINDATDVVSNVPNQKIVSVNEQPIQNQQAQ